MFFCSYVLIPFCQIVTSASSESHIPDMQAHTKKKTILTHLQKHFVSPPPQLLLTSCTRMRHTTRKQARST